MLHLFEPIADARGVEPFQRSPAVPVVVAVAAGILLDHAASVTFGTWLIVSTIAAIAAAWCARTGSRSATATVLLLACAGLGGSWHHWRWSCVADNEISGWATDRGRLVRLRAKVLQPPLVLQAAGDDTVPWRVPERTITLIECRQLVGFPGPALPVSGCARLSIVGVRDELEIGDVIEASGVLVRPAEPANPGDFDTRRWLRAQGLHATVAVDVPEALIIQGRERTIADRIAVVRAAVRSRAERLITGRLGPRTAAVAQSLLLGSRVDMDRELRRAFAESGTLHVLAISGMNVGLLWGWLWLLCRVLKCPPRATLVAVLILLPAYAFITDANPPVVRATIVAVVMAFGQLIGRQTSRWNSLALAALLVLVWNPSDLFNAGAQLSFMAVCAILVTTGFLRSVRIAVELDDRPVAAETSLWRSGLNRLFRAVVEGYVVSLGIWVMTSPLIASQFHLVSPVGFLLNVLLSPLILVMFWFGYSFLLLGLVSPVLFGPIGVPFDICLGWFLSSVQAAAKLDLGHCYVPAPPLWWMSGFYLLTLLLAVVDQRRGGLYWSARGAMTWSVLGLAVALRPGDSSELKCTVLSVGHGLSILVECPNGRTLLYDAGSMSGGSRAARTIERAIWSAGKSRLDALVVSHADADHCNALAELVDVVPTRTLLAHRTFLDWSQPPVSTVIERAAGAGVEIRLLAAGQQIELDPGVGLKVLHPPVDFDSPSDNANSLVLLLEYGGRTILLTGDLERDGLYRQLLSERIDVDVLLSPHHGSLAANPRDLARWANPEWVIASCRDESVHDRLAANFGPATQILSTARHGAIRCRIRSSGELIVEPFKHGAADR